MVWIRAVSRHEDVVNGDLEQLRALLADVTTSGPLMPSVLKLEAEGDGVYRYTLEEFSNGAVTLAPEYQVRFNTSDLSEIQWEPHGEHAFRSWGTFRTTHGAAPGENILEIDTRCEIDVPVAPVMATLVEPFAQSSIDEVTEGFLRALKQRAENGEQA